MSRRHSLGDLQFAIMRLLWRHEEATASEVHLALLEDRGLAPTTIATMLQKMEKKGVVVHRTEGRRFIYRPTISEAQVRTSMVEELTERLFGGDSSALVVHLIEKQHTTAAELAEIKEKIAAHETLREED